MSCRQPLKEILGVSTDALEKKVNGVHPQLLNCIDLRCVNLWINNVKYDATSGTFADGTVAAPGIAFTDQLNTGIYRPSSGVVALSGAGVNLASFSSTGLNLGGNTLSTTVGDLIINPAGSNVDFSGKTLVNVGGISTNPNRYEVVGTQVTTIDATPTVIFSIPTVAAAYTALVDVAVASGTSSGSFSVRLQIKNTGVVTVNTMTTDRRFDVTISAATIIVGASGANVELTATGIAATTIKWQAAATVTRSLY